MKARAITDTNDNDGIGKALLPWTRQGVFKRVIVKAAEKYPQLSYACRVDSKFVPNRLVTCQSRICVF